jgi:hypothetical protein
MSAHFNKINDNNKTCKCDIMTSLFPIQRCGNVTVLHNAFTGKRNIT